MFPIKESTGMTRCRDKYDGFVKKTAKIVLNRISSGKQHFVHFF